MFYIYSPSGRTFAGPMEKLRRVEQADASSFSQVQNDLLSEQYDGPVDGEHYKVPDRAIVQYQSMLKKRDVREAVYHAYQVMTQAVITLPAKSTWGEAYSAFERCSHQVLPVLDSSNMLIATLSRRRLYAALLSNASLDRNRPAIGLIAESERQVIAADPVTDVRRIAKVLIEHSLDAMPVVESSHRLVGIVSRTDLLRCMAEDPPLSLWC